MIATTFLKHLLVLLAVALHSLVSVNASPVPGGGKPSPPKNNASSLKQLWKSQGNKHPTVFIHGLLGWGESRKLLGIINYWGGATQNLLDMLRGQGHTVVAPNVGPLSSCWERACEAFAQMTGTTTDYGVERSGRFNHARFGKDHTGKALVPGFAANFASASSSPVVKVNLVGHSLGGPTARTLAHLLAYGSQAEMDACANRGVACSPLFWTNKTQSYVTGVFAMSGVHQGSVVDDYLQASNGRVQFIKTLFSALVGFNNLNSLDIWDLQLGHHGLNQNSGEIFVDFLDRVCKSAWFLSNTNALFDLSVANQEHPLLSYVKNAPETVYFSTAGVTTNYLLGVSLAQISTNLFLAPFANLIGTYSNSSLSVLNTYSKRDWRQNDGLVMLASSRGPRSGYMDFNLDMDSDNESALTKSAPTAVPVRGTYNYVGEWEGADHLDMVAIFDLVPGLRTKFYRNLMRVLSSLP
ncbi:Alpha/Beta hydrolase protein [Chytriomyces cf. hyalinus JEL632]|nr:Alpha/Beta hydrolase protein [Chytriomyces cf. hyalinus JEL632]